MPSFVQSTEKKQSNYEREHTPSSTKLAPLNICFKLTQSKSVLIGEDASVRGGGTWL